MTPNPIDPSVTGTGNEPILERFEFAVEGEKPEEHARRIEDILHGVAGITQVEAHPFQQRVEVIYDARFTNPAAIHDILVKKRYHAARWAE
jgi:hypothetical protein